MIHKCIDSNSLQHFFSFIVHFLVSRIFTIYVSNYIQFLFAFVSFKQPNEKQKKKNAQAIETHLLVSQM